MKQIAKEIVFLLQKDLTLELRQRHALGGIFLYVLATTYIIYISVGNITPPMWNIFFWIIALFAAMNASARSFVQENSARQLYYYSLVNPNAVLFSKFIYNTVLLFFLNTLTFAALCLFAGNPVKDFAQFALVLGLGSVGLATVFTFVAAIAGKANNSSTLMVILSFPVVIPVLLVLVKLNMSALRLMQDTSLWKDMVILLSVYVILWTLSFLLFPFLWKE